MMPFKPEIPLDGPVVVDIMFHMPIPKASSKSRMSDMRVWKVVPVTRPDLDNMGYVVTNAMNGIMYKDDSQIVSLAMHKRYGETAKIVIKINTYEELCH